MWHLLLRSPSKLFHKSPDSGVTKRVFSKLYNSDAFVKEHDRVQRAPVPPDEPDCKLEKVVGALMFWSDMTHLANFGTAKLWLIYMFFSNLSKYTHAEPLSHACYHVAYIPSLPDFFHDKVASIPVKWNTQKKSILTHCRQELIHGVWQILLDEDFLHLSTVPHSQGEIEPNRPQTGDSKFCAKHPQKFLTGYA